MNSTKQTASGSKTLRLMAGLAALALLSSCATTGVDTSADGSTGRDRPTGGN